ncbi:uncharacterized protein PHA67_001154 [Liasis olivaceus]
MIFSYLIFICIGTYVSCLPIEILRNALFEADRYVSASLDQMENDVQNPLVDIPETLTDDCLKYNLDIFVNSLKQMNQFIPNHKYAVIITRLNEVWHKQEKKGQNCTTFQGGPKKLLEILKRQLEEWHDNLAMRKAT